MTRVYKASEEYLSLKAEVSRMASMANKRLKRLERNELTDLPAYQSWVKGGEIRFSVRGKDYNELQAEFWRLKNFLDNKTSLVRQANKYLKEIAQNTGIKYNNLAELKTQSKKFFELADMVKQYYKMAHKAGQALDYQRIWEQINTQIEEGIIDLTHEEASEATLQKFIDGLNKVVEVEQNKEGFSETAGNWDFIRI